jgi:GNAT superfamily N-acetyltransferase
MDAVEVHQGYMPGAIGRIIELHGTYYQAHWRFGGFFEAKVAVELAEFIRRYDAQRDGFWTVAVDKRVEGSITIDGLHATYEGAHLRWFIMSDVLRGKGMGSRLMHAAVDFCHSHSYPGSTSGPLRGCTRLGIYTNRWGLLLSNSTAAPSGGRRSLSSDSNCPSPSAPNKAVAPTGHSVGFVLCGCL